MTVKAQNPYINTPSDDRVLTVDKESSEAIAAALQNLGSGIIGIFNFGPLNSLVASAAAPSTHKISFRIGSTTYYMLVTTDGGA